MTPVLVNTTEFGRAAFAKRKICNLGTSTLERGTPLSTTKIWPIIRHHFLLFRNRKSHTGFPLVPKSVTLTDLERRNGSHWLTEFGSSFGSKWLKLDPHCLSRKWSPENLHRVRKKGATVFLPVTLRNANRFSKFFYHHTLQ